LRLVFKKTVTAEDGK